MSSCRNEDESEDWNISFGTLVPGSSAVMFPERDIPKRPEGHGPLSERPPRSHLHTALPSPTIIMRLQAFCSKRAGASANRRRSVVGAACGASSFLSRGPVAHIADRQPPLTPLSCDGAAPYLKRHISSG
jgi:hypothetical protein